MANYKEGLCQKFGSGSQARGAVERDVTTVAEAMEALHQAMPLRHTASHALNEHSSRSHCIFSLSLRRRRDMHKLRQIERATWR